MYSCCVLTLTVANYILNINYSDSGYLVINQDLINIDRQEGEEAFTMIAYNFLIETKKHIIYELINDSFSIANIIKPIYIISCS